MDNKPKSKTRFVGPVLTALAVCALCAIPYTGHDNVDNTASTAHTQANFTFLADLIQMNLKLLRKQPPEDINSVPKFFELLSGEAIALGLAKVLLEDINSLPDFFRKAAGKTMPVEGKWSGLQGGSFLDGWGNPIRLVVESPHNYRFISFGPNGKDENGRGDDIVYDFDPLELRDVNEPNETKP